MGGWISTEAYDNNYENDNHDEKDYYEESVNENVDVDENADEDEDENVDENNYNYNYNYDDELYWEEEDEDIESYDGQVLTGEEFNDKFPNLSKILVKLTTGCELHNGFQFHDGENIDTNTFDPVGGCNPGGIYFTDIYNMHKWTNYRGYDMKYYRTVTLPPDCMVRIDKDKFKADKIFLGQRLLIKDLNIWKDKEYCLDIIKENGFVIQYITDPSEEIQLAALEQNYDSIRYITNPTINAQLFAVSNNGYLLQYISNPTDEVQLAAVMNSPFIVNCYKISDNVKQEMMTYERHKEFDEKNIFL